MGTCFFFLSQSFEKKTLLLLCVLLFELKTNERGREGNDAIYFSRLLLLSSSPAAADFFQGAHVPSRASSSWLQAPLRECARNVSDDGALARSLLDAGAATDDTDRVCMYSMCVSVGRAAHAQARTV